MFAELYYSDDKIIRRLIYLYILYNTIRYMYILLYILDMSFKEISYIHIELQVCIYFVHKKN